MRGFLIGLIILVSAAGAQARPLPYNLAPSNAPMPYRVAKDRAAHGNAEAAYWMGLYAAGYDADAGYRSVNFIDAITWLERASRKGYEPAKTPLIYLKDQQAYYASLKTKAERGDREAEYAFSIYLQSVSAAEWSMTDTAFGWRHRAAEHGQPDAEFATSQEAGSEPLAALTWLERAANHGQQRAQAEVIRYYADEAPQHDETKAEYWLRQLAYSDFVVPQDQWDPAREKYRLISSALLTLCPYYEGKGSQDRSARHWMRMWSLGPLAGKAVDSDKAFVCRQHEARIGPFEGRYVLGYDYQYGVGTPVDENQAIYWYRAQLLDGERLTWAAMDLSMIRLALIYAYRGEDAEAYMWLKAAGDSLYRRAGEDDPSSPEAMLPNMTTEIEARQKVFDLGRATLESISARLSANMRAQQDTKAAKLLAKQLPPSSLWVIID